MPHYPWPWPKVRLEILERDGWLCQIRGPHCTGKATTAQVTQAVCNALA